MGLIEVRATVTLPPDDGGKGRAPVAGDVFWVDDEDDRIDGLIRVGYLVPIVRLAMPDALKPQKARLGGARGPVAVNAATGEEAPASGAAAVTGASTPPGGGDDGDAA